VLLCTPESLLQINERIDTFHKEGIDVIAVSADTVEESRELSERLHLRFPIACGLTVEHMETLGLFVHTRDPATSPKYAYLAARRRCLSVAEAEGPIKTWRKPFCEPAHFFLRPNNTVKYQAAPDALYHL
jgi:peroxiredoxin